jgi:O-antigen/teichoic acid export membrane protein
MSWEGWPKAHLGFFRDMVSFSWYAWLFSLSNVLFTSLSVVIVSSLAGPVGAATLQIAIMLFNTVSAFISGGVTPLGTIVARYLGSAEQNLYYQAARRLLGETILITGVALVLFLNFGDMVVKYLLGPDAATAGVPGAVFMMSGILMAAGIATMPLVIFRFALAENTANATYGKSVFWATAAAVALGAAATAVTGNVVVMAIGIAFALVYRSALAYRMGTKVIAVTSWQRLMGSLLVVVIAFEILTVLVSTAVVSSGGSRWISFIIVCSAAALIYSRRAALAAAVNGVVKQLRLR